MHLVSVVFGIAMLVLTGTAVVLGLVILVLYELRWIVRNSHEIGGEEEPIERRHFPDVPPHRSLDNYWQN